MKKFFALLLAAMMVLGMFSAAMADEAPAYKIAIMTGTTSQGEEEYYAATSLAEQYPDIVIHDTYPDNFSSEVETTISKLIAFASDPEVKAIIFVQAVQGATAAFTQILNDMGRDDILLISGVPAEDPADISAVSDIVLANDEIGCGYQVADLASQWGCDVLVHYSFARHLSYETIVAKRDAMKATAEGYGIEFVERDCPDPTGDAGMSGAQAAVLEDIPKVMEEYAGKKVCFYCTNCGLQVALQQAIVNEPNAYYALPCCPSPYHGFQEAFGLTATYGDIDGATFFLSSFCFKYCLIFVSFPSDLTVIAPAYAVQKMSECMFSSLFRSYLWGWPYEFFLPDEIREASGRIFLRNSSGVEFLEP